MKWLPPTQVFGSLRMPPDYPHRPPPRPERHHSYFRGNFTYALHRFSVGLPAQAPHGTPSRDQHGRPPGADVPARCSSRLPSGHPHQPDEFPHSDGRGRGHPLRAPHLGEAGHHLGVLLHPPLPSLSPTTPPQWGRLCGRQAPHLLQGQVRRPLLQAHEAHQPLRPRRHAPSPARSRRCPAARKGGSPPRGRTPFKIFFASWATTSCCPIPAWP